MSTDEVTEAVGQCSRRAQVILVQVPGVAVSFADFSFSVAVRDGLDRWPLGSPWLLRSPPPGLAAIDIHGLYGTATGVHAYPLVTGGLANEAELSQLDGVDVLLIRGLGPGARKQRRHVSLALLPGHRTPRGMVIATLATTAGVTETSVDPGRTMTKELLIESAPWPGTARELAELDGHHLGWDEDGSLRPRSRGRFCRLHP